MDIFWNAGYIYIYIWLCPENPFKFIVKIVYASQIYVSHTFGLRLVTFRQSFHNIFKKSIRSYTFRATPSQFQEHIRLYYVLSLIVSRSYTFRSRLDHVLRTIRRTHTFRIRSIHVRIRFIVVFEHATEARNNPYYVCIRSIAYLHLRGFSGHTHIYIYIYINNFI